MGDRMNPIPFPMMMEWILKEKKTQQTVFGLPQCYHAKQTKEWILFGKAIENPIGPAAGPHTQLAQNIVTAYCAGARYFELKTVQTLDGDDLTVEKPCIWAGDEGYNVEWSTELTVPFAMEEYIKAYIAIAVIAKEFGLGASDGFCFNMSVGYDYTGITSRKIDSFIEGLKDASKTDIYQSCKQWLYDHLDYFEHVSRADIDNLPVRISDSVTLSTLHGCPKSEIYKISAYLLKEKHLHTYVKCNPTLLGYETARRILDSLGYEYISFSKKHFTEDIQYEELVKLIQELRQIADSEGLYVGVKLTNTFPVDITDNVLPGKEMYMSGRALFPLSMAAALKLDREFDSKLSISYSGGADIDSINDILKTGICPVTMATTLLKPGGYARLLPIAEETAQRPSGHMSIEMLYQQAMLSDHYKKSKRTLPKKVSGRVPLTNCFTAPCKAGCPIHQDVPLYLALLDEKRYDQAFRVIVEKNPLPFITGMICAHSCMDYCMRNYYEKAVNIKACKLEAARNGYRQFLKEYRPAPVRFRSRTAVIGGGPAGMAAAYFLQSKGMQTVIYERELRLGGVPANIIPPFRISREAIDHDIELLTATGVKIKTGCNITSVSELDHEYDYIVVATGAEVSRPMQLGRESTIPARKFLQEYHEGKNLLRVSGKVIVIGGGNTAMDCARAAKRVPGVTSVMIVYRRTRQYMPAKEEELMEAVNEGIRWQELCQPVSFDGGNLICKRMMLTNQIIDGRRCISETKELVEFKADTVIAALGEEAAEMDVESENARVFLAGDCKHGPATVAEAIAMAGSVADEILQEAEFTEQNEVMTKYGIDKHTMIKEEGVSEETATADLSEQNRENVLYGRKGVRLEPLNENDNFRCLGCSRICESCVDVCPNRANVVIKLPKDQSHQILHINAMCNECGNCRLFCPYDSAPYKEKFTLFESSAAMADSENDGFRIVNAADRIFEVRYQHKREIVSFENTNQYQQPNLPEEICQMMLAVIGKYSYLLMPHCYE